MGAINNLATHRPEYILIGKVTGETGIKLSRHLSPKPVPESLMRALLLAALIATLSFSAVAADRQGPPSGKIADKEPFNLPSELFSRMGCGPQYTQPSCDKVNSQTAVTQGNRCTAPFYKTNDAIFRKMEVTGDYKNCLLPSKAYDIVGGSKGKKWPICCYENLGEQKICALVCYTYLAR